MAAPMLIFIDEVAQKLLLERHLEANILACLIATASRTS